MSLPITMFVEISLNPREEREGERTMRGNQLPPLLGHASLRVCPLVFSWEGGERRERGVALALLVPTQERESM